MMRWKLLLRQILPTLLVLALGAVRERALPQNVRPAAVPAVSVTLDWQQTHVAPGDTVDLLAGVSAWGTTTPLTVSLTVSAPDGVTIVGVPYQHATTCQTVDLAVTCQAVLTPGIPQGVGVQLRVGDLPAGAQLVASLTVTAGGETQTITDMAFVVAAAPTTVPPTLAVSPTPTTLPATPTVRISLATPSVTAPPTTPTIVAPTDGVPTAPPTTAPSATPTVTPPPSATVRPTGTATSAPATATPRGDGPDRLENNYDRAHATLIAAGEPYVDLTLVAPGGDGLGDIEYVEWFAKAGRCSTLETLDLAPGLDTNIEVLDAADQVIAGNDDVTLVEPRSLVTVCPDHDQLLVARIAQNTQVPLPDPRGKTYTLRLSTTLPPTPTALPATVPPTTVPIPTVVPAATAPPVVVVPTLPAITIPTAGALPPIDVTLPGGVGVSIGGAEPTPSGPTSVPCQPLMDAAAVVTDTAIFAGIESCERSLTIETLPMQTGQARVAAVQASFYAGPGAQYSRLALLPRAYPLTLTGLTRNGWVAVAIQSGGDVPPLVGWVWAAYVRVVTWDGAATPTAAPLVGLSTPTMLPLPTSGPTGPTLTGGMPLTLKPRPAATRSVVVQICRDGAAGTCLPATGVRGARVQILSAAGDIVATGLTDASGRWTTRLPPATGLRVVAPLLGLTGPLAFDRAVDPLVVALSLPAAVIPSAFR